MDLDPHKAYLWVWQERQRVWLFLLYHTIIHFKAIHELVSP
ncbi:hypothetical protein EYZ11_000922 [Aspergillus tanneri]|uniref:Uncharacterized protein n=1 Tax=Aspergillus tanneri TaxID=1220188 RepID=A0A4S3JVX8_9EURO|nr:hypothetical protein EYZ11_000922 [Aspergillus tanneri]